jgi:eukaryotic-like serine/threonine-protein kinase
MLDPKESRFWQATVLSGLMDAQKLTVCWNAISPGKRDDPQHIDRRLARQAVQTRALTLWQAQQLMAGRTSGFKVDRYVLLDLIGQGGMGRVYLAQDTRLNRKVALKILSPERVNNPRAIARFQREARVGAQLQHENLVRIYDFGESSGRFYLVMEYIEGKTIGTLITDQGAIPAANAVRLVRQVAMGLEHAHRKGLIHRDVNPYNILVTRDGTAKLADLGLAIDLAEEDRVTRDGATVGTFDYVAPEQARQSHSADIRSDIYSLGCSLYHMCTGQVPFPTPSLPEKLFAHQAMEPTPLEKLVPDLPQGLAEIVQRMMHKSPDERYSTPLQVAQALEPFADDYSSAAGRDDAQLLKPAAASASQSLRLIEAKAVSLAPDRSSGPASLAVAQSVALKTPPDPTLDRTTEPEGINVTSTIRSPESSEGSDPEFPVDLILSPEPSLTEGLSRPKTRSAPSKSETSIDGTARVRLSQSWLWGLLAITVTVLIIVVVLALVNPPVDTAKGKLRPSPLPSIDKTGQPRESPVAPDVGSGTQKAEPVIVVRIDGEEGIPFSADKLADAIDKAMGGRGFVELRNSEPLHLTSTNHKPLDFAQGRGPLIIRAAPGEERIIDFELSGAKPLLATGSAVSLELTGVTFLVHYSGSAATPPPLISVAGKSKLERCAFKVELPNRPKGCCALFSSLGPVEVERSWFEGFDEAIELQAGYESELRISQTMIVPGSGGGPIQAQPSESYGWGVKCTFKADLRSPAKGTRSKPNFILDHCTVEGAGLFDLTSSPGPAPIQLAVNQCAFRANTLLAFNPKRPEEQQQIYWEGTANQYDILGRTWIVHSTEGSPAFSTGVTDLGSWLHITPGEKNTILSKLKYQVDPTKRPAPLRPRDFAIEAQAPPQSRPGANPALVGPWSNP